MPYCSSEQRLHGYDEPEVELQSSDYDEDDGVSAEVTIIRPCSYCGTAAATYDAEMYDTIYHDCPFAADDDAPKGYDVEFDDPEAEDYSQTHDRRGKPIKSSRYAKHLFAVRMPYTAKCRACSEDIQGFLEERDIAASSFDADSH